MSPDGVTRRRKALDQRLVDLPVPVLGAAAAVLVAVVLTGVVRRAGGPAAGPIAMTGTLAVSFGPLGVFVLRRLPGHPIGRLMVFTGLAATVATLATSWSAPLPLAWASQWTWWPPLAAIPLILLLFPDGRLPSRRWRPVAVTLVATAAAALLALASAAMIRPRTFISTTEVPPPAVRALALVAVAAIAVFLLAALLVLVALIGRWRPADQVVRRQLACLSPSAVLLVVGVGLDFLDVSGGWPAAAVALPVGLAVAVLRYRLHDLDLYVHRGSVWLVLTLLAAAVYALTATAIGVVFVAPDHWLVAMASVGAVAAVLHPAQRLAQRGVSRLLYGRRDDPYSVLTSMVQQMEVLDDPREVLPRFTATLVAGLRIPYAAIELVAADGVERTRVEHGRRAWEPRRFPMVAHGREVGELLVTPRSPGAAFTAAETRLLGDLAAQGALAVEAARGVINLQRARERLVRAREEERWRLHRDLHDGVASALVGARMLAEAARRYASAGSEAPPLLQTLVSQLDACADEVRAMIDELRPAVLDQGLEHALRRLAAQLPEPAPRVSLRVEGDLTELPAAIEVATYRIVAEALTNVVKHARARHCTVALDRSERELSVRIADDGVGLTATGGARADARNGTAGVGLGSIISRAEELGGSCETTSTGGGTVIHAVLPIRN